MSTLTSKRRKAMKKSQFGLPESRRYPMPDKAHAQNAMARASQQLEAGNLTPAEKAKIDAKARGILGS